MHSIAVCFTLMSAHFKGKWHLGSGCQWFGTGCLGPGYHGFDHFYGLLFTLSARMKADAHFWIFNFNEPFYQVIQKMV